jgi:ATP-binding cassette, subfamily B, bacterial MsbA
MSPLKTFLRLLKYFLKYKWRITAGLISVAIMSSSDTASAYLIARLFETLQTIGQQVRGGLEIAVPISISVFDHVFYSFTVHGKEESFQLIYKFAVAVIIIILIKVTFVYIREYVMSSVQQKILMRFRVDLFESIVALPIRYFDENKTGYIMSRITNDVNNLEQSLNLIIEIAQNLVYTVVFATALFMTNWKLTIVTILIFALSGEISRKFGDRIRKYSRDLTNTLAEISAFLQEKIAAIRIVKSFTREEDEKKTFRNKVGNNYHYSMKIVRVMALLSPTNELFNTTAASLLVIFSGYLFIVGTMTIETMIFFLILMINLAKPVKALGESAARIQKTLVSAGYIFEILDLPKEVQKKSSYPFVITKGTVEFQNVSFAYTKDIQALREVNLRVDSGEKIALVGPSGGGKSTLINLIPRF